MTSRLSKAASLLAFTIGAMAMFAGGRVLLGQIPDYNIIPWLPGYNFAAGTITFMFTAVMIWRGHKWAMPAAIATLSAHAIVLIALRSTYSDVVATESIVAMTVRVTTWIIILALMFVQSRKREM